MEKATKWIREWWRFVVLIVIIVFTVFSIGLAIYRLEIQPKEGIVVRKDYYPEYTSTEYRTITKEDGKTMRIPMLKHHAARYIITISGINSKGEEDYGYYDVNPVEFQEIEIGDYYIKQKGALEK